MAGHKRSKSARRPRPASRADDPPAGTSILANGRRLLYFGGCDYHRLSAHPRVIEAVRTGLKEHGLNVAASRVTTGDHPLYAKLEKALARFFDAPAAVLAPTGYQSSLLVAGALAGEMDHVILDDRAHYSLIEAAERFDCPVLRFRHGDLEDFVQVVRSLGTDGRPVLLTDGVFSHDGSVAPLRAYAKVLPPRAWMLVDDAHGAGVIGARGRGSLEFEKLRRRDVVQTITLSKGFGVYGGAVLCSQSLARRIMVKGRLFAGATPLPLPLVNATLASLKLVSTDRSLVERLQRNAYFVKARLLEAGWPDAATPGPIVSFVPASARQAGALKKRLLDGGILPPLIRYGNGPAHGYFRFAISSAHTQEQLENLVSVLTEFLKGGSKR